ncbi:MAG: homoserine dehydrogenase [Thermoplasmatota archaeon]
MKTVRLLLAGYGGVGRALHQIVHERRTQYQERYGIDLVVTGIGRSDRVASDGEGLAPGHLDWQRGALMDELLWECPADILVEVTPTDLAADGQPAVGHCKGAIKRGLHVVTANKGPVVHAWKDLQERAAEAGVKLGAEATVAAAVPVLNAGRQAFGGDTVTRIEGILNGTTNFMLTRMATEGSDFDQVLREAQELGYAETDPSGDVDGHDAAAKVVIMGNQLLGLDLSLEDVETTGIRSVTAEATEVALAHGYRIKLIGEVATDGKARVGPRLVPFGDTLDVGGALNAVRFHRELGGPVTHTETAAALLADIVEIARDG